MKKVLAILLAASMLLSFAGCQSSDYKKAVSLQQEGSYAAAAEAFSALQGYKDSADRLSACRYTLAKAEFDAENYAAAADAFAALGSYEESESYLSRANDALLRAELVGSWKGEADLSELMTESVLGGMGESAEMFPDLSLQGICAMMQLELTEKGTFTLSYDKDSLEGALNNVIDQMVDVLYDYFEKTLEEELAAEGVTMEAALELFEVESVPELVDTALGMTIREMMDSMLPMESLLEMANQKDNGVFTVEDGKITATIGSDDEELIYEDGKLTLQDEDFTVTFTKG